MQVSWLASEKASAATAERSRRKRPVHSSAKCIASHMLPPLPHDRSCPPALTVFAADRANRRTFSRQVASPRKAERTLAASSNDARTGAFGFMVSIVAGGGAGGKQFPSGPPKSAEGEGGNCASRPVPRKTPRRRPLPPLWVWPG